MGSSKQRALEAVAKLRPNDCPCGISADVQKEHVRVLDQPVDMRNLAQQFVGAQLRNWTTLKERRSAHLGLFNRIVIGERRLAYAIALYENGRDDCRRVTHLLVIPYVDADPADVDSWLDEIHQALGVQTSPGAHTTYTVYKGHASFAKTHRKFFCEPPEPEGRSTSPSSASTSSGSPQNSGGSPPKLSPPYLSPPYLSPPVRALQLRVAPSAAALGEDFARLEVVVGLVEELVGLVEKEPEAASVEDLAEDALLNALPDDQDELTEMIAVAPDILRGLLQG